MQDIGSITPEDLETYSKENQYTAEEELIFKQNYFDAVKSEADNKYKDNSDHKLQAQQYIEGIANKSLLETKKKFVQEQALSFAEGDREQANEILNNAFLAKKDPSKIDPNDIITQRMLEAYDNKDFQLNEKTSSRPEYLNDAKGNPMAQITVRSKSDGSRTAYYKFLNNKEAGITELETQEFNYKLPTEEERVAYLDGLAKEIDEKYPQGAKGDTQYADNIRRSFDNNPSKESQGVRDLIAKYREIKALPPERQSERIAILERNKSILNSDFVRNNVTDFNIFEDAAKGALRFYGSTINSLTDGGEQDNLNILNSDSSYGSDITGLRDDENLKKLIPSGVESFGNMIIPIGASILSGGVLGPTAGSLTVLGGMGVSSYGQQLNQNDSQIEYKESELNEKLKIGAPSSEIKLIKKDLDSLRFNRRLNALGHAIVETVTESLGGFGGLLIKPASSFFGKVAENVIFEGLEEQVAEPLNYLVDQMTLGDRLTPEMQDPLSIGFTTLIATGPLAFIGGKSDAPGFRPKYKGSTDELAVNYNNANPQTVRTNAPFSNGGVVTSVDKDGGIFFKPIAENVKELEKNYKNGVTGKEASDNSEINTLPASENSSVDKKSETDDLKGQVKFANDVKTVLSDYNKEEPVIDKAVDDFVKSITSPEVENEIQSNEKVDSEIEIPDTTQPDSSLVKEEVNAIKGDKVAPEASKPNASIKVNREVLDHGHSIFESVTDFKDFSVKMVEKFGNSISSSLQSIWDFILSSFSKSYNAISDSISYANQKVRGGEQSLSQVKDLREFNKGTNVDKSSPKDLLAIQDRFPNLYNTALQSVLSNVDSNGEIGIKPSDLARMYSFKEKGFDNGVDIVDEGKRTAELEGRDYESPAFVNSDGIANDQALPLTNYEQDVLRTLYKTKVISEDQLSEVARGLSKKRKLLALYSRIQGPGIESLGNAADSTITDKERRQSKVKEAYSVDAIMNPSNPDVTDDKFITKSFEHGTGGENDVFTHLGIEFKTLPANSENNQNDYDYTYMTKPDLRKLYKFYDTKFGKNNWVIKDSEGAQGKGFHSAESLRKDLRKSNYEGISSEGVAQKKIDINSEYRVNVYVDKDGKARVIPFATSKKEIYEDGQTGHETPYRLQTNVTRDLGAFAEKALSFSNSKKVNKNTGRGAIYGVDVAILNNEDGSDPFSSKGNLRMKVIEFNSPDPYIDSNNIGGMTGTFSMHQGYPMANLVSFLQGKVPADIALTNVMVHLLKSGKMKVDGQSLVPNYINKKNEALAKARDQAAKAENISRSRGLRFNSGIDPTNIINDIKTLYEGVKTFALFSKRMMEKYGPSVKIHLNELWSKKSTPEQLTNKYIVGLGVDKFEEAAKGPLRIEFKTERGGSTYVVDGETTTRDKKASNHPDHQDSGIKSKSDRTVYLSSETSEDIGIIYTEPLIDKDGSKKRPSVKIADNGESIILTWYQGKDHQGNLIKRVKSYNSTLSPKVGLQPFEQMNGSVHLGSKIISITTSPSRTETIQAIANNNPVTDVYKSRIDTRYISEKSARALQDIKDGKVKSGDASTIVNKVKIEERKNKFKELKKTTPAAFESFTPDYEDPNFINDATEALLNYLDTQVESDPLSDKRPRTPTKQRVEAQNHLNENLGLFWGGYVNHDEFLSLPLNLREVIISGVNQIGKIDDLTSTNNIKRAAASLGSLLENGNPVGFMKYAQAEFDEKWFSKSKNLAEITEKNSAGMVNDLIGDRLGKWRRLNISNDFGSMIHIPTELDKMSRGSTNTLEFLSDLFSVFKGNLDPQQVERDLEQHNQAEYVNSLYPRRKLVGLVNEETNSMPVMSRVTTGIASHLIQYKKLSANPIEDLQKAYNLMNLGIDYRSQTEGQDDMAAIDRSAFNYLTQGLVYDGTVSHNDIIDTILSRLSPQEKDVLKYIIDRGQSFLPSMRAVSSVSANRQLEEWENYVHVKVMSDLSQTAKVNSYGVGAFNSMEPPLQIRKGIGTEKGANGRSAAKAYYETDVLNISDDFYQMATYEKHTGVQRMLLKSLLDNKVFTDMLEKKGKDQVKPRTEALKDMLGNIHAIRSHSNYLSLHKSVSAVLETIGLSKGVMIISGGSMAGNFASAVASITGLMSLEGKPFALFTSISLEKSNPFGRNVRKELKAVLKDNFPHQLVKLTAYDETRTSHKVSNNSIRNFETALAANRGGFNSLISSAIGVSYSIPIKLAKKMVRGISYLTSSLAEGVASNNMWWAVYINEVNKRHGKNYKSASEFLDDPVIDHDASGFATIQVDKITGNTSEREMQGSTYHLDTLSKVGVTNSILVFSRQIVNLQNQLVNELQHIKSADSKGVRLQHIGRAASIFGNIVAYSVVKYKVGTLIYDSITSSAMLLQTIVGDDEEKKKAMRLEIAKQRKLRERRMEFNTAYDVLGTAFLTPLVQSTVARFIAENAHDKIRVYPEDIQKEMVIQDMIKEVNKKKNDLKVIGATGPLTVDGKIATYNSISDEIEGIESSIEEARNLKGLALAPKSPTQAASSMLGALSVIPDLAYPLIGAFEEQGELKEALHQRVEEINKFPMWGVVLDSLSKTGARQFSKNVATKMAADQINAERTRETELKKNQDKVKRSIGL